MSLSTPLNQLPSNNNQQNTPPPQMQPPQMSPPQMQPQQMPPPQMQPQQMQPPQMQPQQIPPPQQSNNEGQMVDDILNELDITDDNTQLDINTETYNYAMDPSQIPPEKLEGNFLEAKENNYMEESPNILPEQPKVGLLGIDLSEDTFMNKIIKIVKNPLFVFVIVFLLSLPQFNRLFFGLFPQFLLENGQIKVTGILVKSIIATGLYILFNFLL